MKQTAHIQLKHTARKRYALYVTALSLSNQETSNLILQPSPTVVSFVRFSGSHSGVYKFTRRFRGACWLNEHGGVFFFFFLHSSRMWQEIILGNNTNTNTLDPKLQGSLSGHFNWIHLRLGEVMPSLYHFGILCRAVSRRLFTSEARFRGQDSPSGVFGGSWRRFSPSPSVFRFRFYSSIQRKHLATL